MAGIDIVIEEKKDDAIDRQRVCPFLLRVFVSSNQHHKLVDFTKGNAPQNELQIYTWKDATLNELAHLVKEVNPETRRKGTKFSFALVFPDARSPQYRMREIGSIISGQKGQEDLKTLLMARLSIGDYMDIAITPPDTWNSSLQRSYPPQRNIPYNSNHRQSRPY